MRKILFAHKKISRAFTVRKLMLIILRLTDQTNMRIGEILKRLRLSKDSPKDSKRFQRLSKSCVQYFMTHAHIFRIRLYRI